MKYKEIISEMTKPKFTLANYFGSFVIVDPEGNFVRTVDGCVFETGDKTKAKAVLNYLNHPITQRQGAEWMKQAFKLVW